MKISSVIPGNPVLCNWKEKAYLLLKELHVSMAQEGGIILFK